MKNSYAVVIFAAFVVLANGSFHFAARPELSGASDLASLASSESTGDAHLLLKDVDPRRVQLSTVKGYFGSAASILVKLDGEEVARIGADEPTFNVRLINHTNAQIFQFSLPPHEVALRVSIMRQRLMSKLTANEAASIDLRPFYTGGGQAKGIELDELLQLVK